MKKRIWEKNRKKKSKNKDNKVIFLQTLKTFSKKQQYLLPLKKILKKRLISANLVNLEK
jgi:hypothetical protein